MRRWGDELGLITSTERILQHRPTTATIGVFYAVSCRTAIRR
jgi:hypothetical protein